MWPINMIIMRTIATTFLLVTICINRNKQFEGVGKSPVVSYESNQRRRFLSFGQPSLGRNGGNTPYNTHRVLQIIRRAIATTRNCGDGGWPSALAVC